MLSYRHAFHAGNFADLLKHLIQIEIINYLKKKDKPFDYIDTHAGAGIYQLTGSMADKNKEYLNGIGHFLGERAAESGDLDALIEQVNICQQNNATGDTVLYPGSPAIASQLIRKHDKAWLHELHPADFSLLEQQFHRNRNIYVKKVDGFQGLLGLLPCLSRRAFVLIDPPYEIKDDYEKVVDIVCKAHRKMSNTIFAIWYPVVERERIEVIGSRFKNSGIANICRFELGIKADTQEKGMTSAGMIVINPPWTLFGKMQKQLPELAKIVSQDGNLHFKCEQWVAE
ncbi:23S rRNA (adenine(2030)-N(6))-methyltransferase RlmJ [Alteromonas sp. a30]|uniref:23S rRNA (adenine(2030)-N(6))-methyltransferase RlmJ n=1 Tax=Alteromonas sp. a30 TaxID=2730917 RepID=UPI00227EDC5E|nr:23S rRNA (adenine(2030)-N(6))-methyltransferase RlmJ [Alteromonas sp. a30]MCY7297279.1 23S rRNA (adenine(2030)-N(6))-methyltransferase RlmJ [Alteromonas sp. a30]